MGVEIFTILAIGAVILVAWVLLKFALKLTFSLFRVGCGIIILLVLGAILFFIVFR